MEGVTNIEVSYISRRLFVSKVISYYYYNLLAEHFGINKTRELVARNYF